MSVEQGGELERSLRANYLFAGLNNDQLAAVLASANRCILKAEQTLFEQGQSAGRFFWIREGTVKLSRLSPSGEEKVIELLSSGQTFAEALMFMEKGGSYPVTAQALGPSEVIGFENQVFLSVLHDSVDTCFRLMAEMSRRLHGLVNEIDQLALQSATARVADFLLSRVEEGRPVQLQTPKHVLASRLSVKPETLSRIFGRLSASGAIRVDGSRIEVCDGELLRSYGTSLYI